MQARHVAPLFWLGVVAGGVLAVVAQLSPDADGSDSTNSTDIVVLADAPGVPDPVDSRSPAQPSADTAPGAPDQPAVGRAGVESATDASPIPWIDLDEARERQAEDGRPVFRLVLMGRPGCKPCEQLKKLLDDDLVAPVVAELAHCVIDTTFGRAPFLRVDHAGEPSRVFRVDPRMQPEDLAKWLKKVLAPAPATA